MPKFRPTGSATPVRSHAASNGRKLGKDCDSKVDIKGWPSINALRTWRLAFKKAVASVSRRSKLAFKWITAVESAKSLEKLAYIGDFEELDAKLSKALDDIISGEFQKKVQVKETEYSKEGFMRTGRQITWMLYEYFKVSETDGAMLDWDELLSVELRGDNLQQFLSDLETTLLSINGLPDSSFLETLFRKQLKKMNNSKNP